MYMFSNSHDQNQYDDQIDTREAYRPVNPDLQVASYRTTPRAPTKLIYNNICYYFTAFKQLVLKTTVAFVVLKIESIIFSLYTTVIWEVEGVFKFYHA